MVEGVSTGNDRTMEWKVLDDAGAVAAAIERPSYEAGPEHLETFSRDGVVKLARPFDDWVEPLRAGLERILARPDDFAFPCDSVTEGEPGRFFDAYCNWQLVPEFTDFVMRSSAASMAAAFMRSSSAQFFHEHAFSKEAGTSKATPFHHDLPYYCVDGTQTATVYVALDETPVETAVRFLKGSHRSGSLYRPRTFRDGAEYATDDIEMESVREVGVHGSEVFAEPLSPGDALVFDFRTLHGTTDAVVETRRRAFSTRWLGDDVRYLNRQGVTSPPLGDLGLETGDRMREDLFPILWP